MKNIPEARFNIGMTVKYKEETGCLLPGKKAEIFHRKYQSSPFSLWLYHLHNSVISKDAPYIISEWYLEIVPPTTEIECIKHALAAANEDWEVQVPKEEVWLPLSKFFARHSVPGHGFNEGTDTYIIRHFIKSWQSLSRATTGVPIMTLQENQVTPSFSIYHDGIEYCCRVDFDDQFDSEPQEIKADNPETLAACVASTWRQYIRKMLKQHQI